LDLKKDKKYIITQVLNYGTWEDLKLMNNLSKSSRWGMRKPLKNGTKFLDKNLKNS